MPLAPPCPILDIHSHPPCRFRHLSPCEPADELDLIHRYADPAGVRKLVSFDIGYPPSQYPEPQVCREANDHVLAMRDLEPDFILPFCYVNPQDPDAAVAEIDRCVGEHGAVGIKLWVACRASDPRLDPIAERAIELDVPILQHAWLKTTGNLPDESTPDDVAHLARRYPRARIIMAHLAGIGPRGLASMADCPNIVVDTSGGDPEAGIVRMAVDMLGSERILYGSDAPVRNFGIAIARIIGEGLSPEALRQIYWDNAARLLPASAGVKPLTAADWQETPLFGGDTPFIDVNAWTGTWPTYPVKGDAAAVHDQLRDLGARQIHLSPLAAAWYRNAHLANSAVYAAADEYEAIRPAPVIDPTLADWCHELDRAATHAGCRVIRLLPTYHSYELSDIPDLFSAAEKAGLIVAIQSKLEDPRRAHPLAQVPNLSLDALPAIAAGHPDLRLILGGMRAVSDHLLALPNLYVELSQADGMNQLHHAVQQGHGGTFLFGSHVPIMSPVAAIARVVTDLSATDAQAILHDNAARLLS